MFCMNCGAQIASGTSSCPRCGVPLTPQPRSGPRCPRCGGELPPGQAFCPNCGFMAAGASMGRPTPQAQWTWQG
ncbi:MAG: zinc-ribbon domain-containing protein, partial [Olsenella sp.]